MPTLPLEKILLSDLLSQPAVPQFCSFKLNGIILLTLTSVLIKASLFIPHFDEYAK